MNPCLANYFQSSSPFFNAFGQTVCFEFKGSDVVFYNNNLVGFKSTNSFFDNIESGVLIKPFANVGDKWQFNGMEIKCIEKGVQNILGTQDSVKAFVFTQSSTANIFVLSKSYGIIQFYPVEGFYVTNSYFKVNPKTKTIPKYSLIGWDNNVNKRGYYPPTFTDYFHLQKGTKLFWETFPYDGEGYNKLKTGTSLVQEVKYVIEKESGIIYGMNCSVYNIDGELVSNYDRNLTFDKSEMDELLSIQPYWFKIMNYNFDNELLNCSFTQIENIDGMQRSFMGIFSTGGRIVSYNETCEFQNVVDYWVESVYSTQFGLIEDESKRLVGATVGGVTWGDVNIITSKKELNASSDVAIYPNPVKDVLRIESSQREVTSIEIYDLLGQLISRKNFASTIDLKDIKPGTYLLKIYQNTECIKTHKLIKQ